MVGENWSFEVWVSYLSCCVVDGVLSLFLDTVLSRNGESRF